MLRCRDRPLPVSIATRDADKPEGIEDALVEAGKTVPGDEGGGVKAAAQDVAEQLSRAAGFSGRASLTASMVTSSMRAEAVGDSTEVEVRAAHRRPKTAKFNARPSSLRPSPLEASQRRAC